MLLLYVKMAPFVKANFKTVTIGHSDTPPSFKFYPFTSLFGKLANNLLIIIFDRLLFWALTE